MKTIRWISRACLPILILTGCTSQGNQLTASPPTQSGISVPPTAALVIHPTPTPVPAVLWISPAAPLRLRHAASEWKIPLTDTIAQSTVQIEIGSPAPGALDVSTWIYALVAPFPTVMDGISSKDLRAFWLGASPGPFDGVPLLMDESTLAAFTALWGAPAAGAVKNVPAGQLLDAAWGQLPSWALIPFEDLQPRWKVLAVDGLTPIARRFNPIPYPLVISYRLRSTSSIHLELPSGNYDPSKLTTVIMTGVTALVRATAATMEAKGVLYPGRDLRDLLREADLLHINNEVPFYTGCPTPDPDQRNLIFCTDPRYMDLLMDIGMDVVELTGNHFADYGPQAMDETLKIYDQAHIPYYGGGADLQDALKPARLERNGNKIAFIGCNRPDTGKFNTANPTRSGAAPCDFDYLTRELRQLDQEGYVVISTFQWSERYDSKPVPLQVDDFQRMADAGADVVSGSQAHYPQIMEFRDRAFLHYGLGNLFFDQMDKPVAGTRREFLDRYVIYDGRLVSIELLTMLLEDFSRPRPMHADERAAFLAEYFHLSGWTPAATPPTPWFGPP